MLQNSYGLKSADSNIVNVTLSEKSTPKKDHEILAVKRPELAVLKSVEDSCIRSLGIGRIEENRDNHASFQDICDLLDRTTHTYNSTYGPLDTGTDVVARSLV